MKRTLIGWLAVLAALAVPAAAETWNLDSAHSSAQFSVRHMMVSNVRGEFARMTGVLELDPAEITRSHVEATIEAASVNTREPRRDTHLKSPDFLDVATYPTLTFRSQRVASRSGGAVVGDEVTITLDLEFRKPGPGGAGRPGAR